MNNGAFVPQSTFISKRLPCKRACTPLRPKAAAQPTACAVKSADAMEFFRHREGKWSSWRVTHHLAFRRAESGESEIEMRVLEKSDERIQTLCTDHGMDPSRAQGGCYVTWKATMAWDQEGENHEGSTVFALVPEEEDMRRGKILRDRGYAEIVPIAGSYYLDENDDLCLETPYDGGAVEERFSFDGRDVVNRISTVRRFGGFSTATFATETRVGSKQAEEQGNTVEGEEEEDILGLLEDIMVFSPGTLSEEERRLTNGREAPLKPAFGGRSRYGSGTGRFGTTNSHAPPSANSAFGSGFSSGGDGTKKEEASVNSAFTSGISSEQKQGDEETVLGISAEALEEARKQGIDLLKIPPSMRDDFVASFNNGNK